MNTFFLYADFLATPVSVIFLFVSGSVWVSHLVTSLSFYCTPWKESFSAHRHNAYVVGLALVACLAAYFSENGGLAVCLFVVLATCVFRWEFSATTQSS